MSRKFFQRVARQKAVSLSTSSRTSSFSQAAPRIFFTSFQAPMYGKAIQSPFFVTNRRMELIDESLAGESRRKFTG